MSCRCPLTVLLQRDIGMTEPEVGVGVGPWEGEWPVGDHYDEQLLREGDRRNVVDRYRYWRREAIVADLDLRRHAFHVAIENWQHDFNIGSIVRTANAFAVAEVHIVGQAAVEPPRRDGHRPLSARAPSRRRRRVRRVGAPSRAARGRHRQPARLGAARDRRAAARLRAAVRPGGPRAVRRGARRPATRSLSIAQFGSTRSINAGAAAAIAMHTWIRQHADLHALTLDDIL